MKDTILNLLLNEIYNKVVVIAEIIEKIPSLKIVLEQASANDHGIKKPISACHLEKVFECVAKMRKERVENDVNLSEVQKELLKTAIDTETNSRITFARGLLQSHGILGD